MMLAVTGLLMVASAYGMARFGVGLFGPRLAAGRSALTGVLDWAGTTQFASYCVAAAAATRFVDRRPRTGLVLAGATAVLGCAGVAVANHPILFLAAVAVGGMSGGLASAALVPIIDAAVAPDRSATAQSIANSGSAIGLVAVGLIALLPVGSESAWLLMAAFSGLVAAACWRLSRRRRGTVAPPQDRFRTGPHASRSALILPAVAAGITGAGSALVWTFGPVLVTGAGAVGSGGAGALWIAAGAGGLTAGLTGKFAARVGVASAWCWLAVGTAAAVLVLGAAVATAGDVLAIAAMVAFGGTYISLTGVLILWARRVAPGTAGAATSVLFIALALGQSAGSALFGLLREALAPTVVILLAAGLCAVGGVIGGAADRATTS